MRLVSKGRPRELTHTTAAQRLAKYPQQATVKLPPAPRAAPPAIPPPTIALALGAGGLDLHHAPATLRGKLLQPRPRPCPARPCSPRSMRQLFNHLPIQLPSRLVRCPLQHPHGVGPAASCHWPVVLRKVPPGPLPPPSSQLLHACRPRGRTWPQRHLQALPLPLPLCWSPPCARRPEPTSGTAGAGRVRGGVLGGHGGSGRGAGWRGSAGAGS